METFTRTFLEETVALTWPTSPSGSALPPTLAWPGAAVCRSRVLCSHLCPKPRLIGSQDGIDEAGVRRTGDHMTMPSRTERS